MQLRPAISRRTVGPPLRAMLLLATSALLFGVMAVLARRATDGLPGLEVTFMRFAIGLAAVAGSWAAGYPLRPVNTRGLLLRGTFGAMAVTLYFSALAHLPVGVATLLTYTA